MMKLIALIGVIMAAPACTADNVFGPYLGQTQPGLTPVPFAPGMVNTDAVELNSVFTPDGREFFFTRMVDGPDMQPGYPGKGRLILFHSVLTADGWTEPQPLRLFPGGPHAWAADMSVSPDGRHLYFMGPHPVTEGSTRSDLNIWTSQKIDGVWSAAEPLPEPVNSLSQEVYSSVVADGSLYFTTYPEDNGTGRGGLYRAQALKGGGFAAPEKVAIAGADSVGDTFVAPDESYLVFSASLPNDTNAVGGGDLYVSFKGADGTFGAPINMGPEVNSTDLDFCPVVSPDGKYFFFSRRRSDPANGGWPKVVAGDVFWVSAGVIERLRPE